LQKQNWFTRHETDIFLNNHCQESVRAYLSIHECLTFRHEVMIGNHRNITTETRNLQIRVHVYRPRHCCGD
jgi:hypothetical protein